MKFRILIALLVAVAGLKVCGQETRPNILIAISDDHTWLHTSALGFKAVQTPAFDRVAKSGVLFNNCFAGSPGCSPSRAALLTGRQHWQIQQAGTHASSFPAQYVTFPDLLEQSGYFVGYTGKGWGPGNWEISGRTRNPAGTQYGNRTLKPPHRGLSNNDYASNFADFLAARSKDKPFCFWYGASEPHRQYAKGSGIKAGKKLEDATVPSFLPDTKEIRSDLLDYALEIEWFDSHLDRILKSLELAGELENTLIIVTGDNGMPFPRAKANLYEYGIHVPLAVSWKKRIPANRTVNDLVGFVDLTATILAAAQVEHPGHGKWELAVAGRSLMNILTTDKQGLVDPSRTMAFSGRERHSSSRRNNLGYPCRALRTQDYLYIRNFHSDRWPAGAPQKFDADGSLGPMHGGYHDIDACPSFSYLIDQREDPQHGRFFQWAVAKRSDEELFNIRRDPGCLKDLSSDPAFDAVRKRLRNSLETYLKETGDPRAVGDGEIWESYPRYSRVRKFPGDRAK